MIYNSLSNILNVNLFYLQGTRQHFASTKIKILIAPDLDFQFTDYLIPVHSDLSVLTKISLGYMIFKDSVSLNGLNHLHLQS